MATAAWLLRFLAQIRHYFLRILVKNGTNRPQAPVQLLRRLAAWWSSFHIKWKSWRNPHERVEKPPSSDAVGFGLGKRPKPLEPSEEQGLHPDTSYASCATSHYTIHPNRAVMSLDNVVLSLYPSATGISVSEQDDQELELNDRITITVEPIAPQSPTSIQKHSTSGPLPQFLHHHAENSQYRPSSPIRRHLELNSPREIDITSVDIPTRAASATCVYLENARITPAMPEATERYNNRPRIQKRETAMTIQPLTVTFENPMPHGWTKCIHPEGCRYFFHKDKRIYTDANLYDSRIFTQLCRDMNTLENFTSANGITLPEDSDLVIELQDDEDEGDLRTTYYYAHHPSRSIFFLDTFEADDLCAWTEAPGATSKSHLRHEIEAQYWFFLLLFPHSRKITEELACELRDIILYFIADWKTSPSTTSPYSLDDLHKFLPLADKLQTNIGREYVGATSLLARLMYMFVHSRFLNFYGEPCARIERQHSVYGTPIVSRTWLVRSLSPLLFSAPDFHLQTLQKMWVDNLMHKTVWEKSLKKMSDEWQEFVLFATVMLNANVAFLAIQSVDSNPDNVTYRSPAQISSYLSVVASVGSIILGLLLVRQTRTKSRESADEMQAFMANHSHPRLGLETLAILYSLPYALLMWGMISFVAAFCFMCFQQSNTQTRAVVGPFCFAVAVLVVWCMWTLWEVQPKRGRFLPTMLSKLLRSLPSFSRRRQSVDSQQPVLYEI